jgi:hypothetical protein
MNRIEGFIGNSKLKTVFRKVVPLSHKKIKRLNLLREELSFRKNETLSGRRTLKNGT